MSQRSSLRPLTMLLVVLAAANASAQPGIIPFETGPEPPEFAGILEAHNGWRARAGVPPLRWSPTAQAQASGWAQQLARENCALRFNPDEARRKNWGENLYRSYSAQTYESYKRTPREVIERWAGEGESYDPQTGRCTTRSCGQYTQLMWDTTEVVGCARARCPTAEVWVCNYTPRGNVEGLKPYGSSAADKAAILSPAPAAPMASVASECQAAPGWIEQPEGLPYSPG